MTESPAWASAPPAAPPADPPAAAPAPSYAIPPELLAELEALREDRRKREAREAADAAEQAARMSAPSHHVHLADGSVIEGSQIGTHHTTGDGSGHHRGDHVLAVVGAYLK